MTLLSVSSASQENLGFATETYLGILVLLGLRNALSGDGDTDIHIVRQVPPVCGHLEQKSHPAECNVGIRGEIHTTCPRGSSS